MSVSAWTRKSGKRWKFTGFGALLTIHVGGVGDKWEIRVGERRGSLGKRTSRSSSGHDRMKAGAPACFGSADSPVDVARSGSRRFGRSRPRRGHIPEPVDATGHDPEVDVVDLGLGPHRVGQGDAQQAAEVLAEVLEALEKFQ